MRWGSVRQPNQQNTPLLCQFTVARCLSTSDNGDKNDPMSHLDSDGDIDPCEERLPTQIPDGFHLQESKPATLDHAFVKRYVLLQCGMG